LNWIGARKEKGTMKRMLAVLGVLGAMGFAQVAEAWRPSGWVYHDYPWAYDASSGDWHWFNTANSQWVANMGSGQWAKLPNSALASGWVYYDWAFAYAQGNGAWHWINAADTQWVVNMRTSAWSRWGAAASALLYMVVDLSGGPSASSYPVSYLDAVPAGGWTDEYKTTKLVLRKIPEGSFTMGSPTNELGRWDDEAQHSVTLTKDMYMGVFEVTQKQWERVMGDWPSYFNNASYRDSRPVEQRSWNDIRGGTWPGGQPGAGTFMQRISARTGLAFDLPTESQWEYACRAGTTTALNSGKNLTTTTNCPNMAEVGRYWYNGGSGYSSGGDTNGGSAKVGSYLANAWGLYDMHGNVWEWCLDWYGPYPGAVSDPAGAASGSFRMKRGGGWSNNARYCRSANRSYGAPVGRSDGLGFRISRTLP
jgi:formylglycine-generating enzyme required for sulfatase activity